jgi:4-amino-4-deoxy-L-arabinose transferase-like glycosyltransferase
MSRVNHKAERGAVGWIGVGVVAMLGLALRLWDLSGRAFSHPENYTSGLSMPEWMPMVARRVDLKSLVYGTLGDGHPPLYYAFQMLWTSVFGTELWALRLPSVLFGTATILVVYAIARHIASRPVALMTAGLLALHGHHIFYSQLARLYVFAGFFAALSTLFFLRARASHRASDHVAYVVSASCALWSHLYCWPVIFTQLVWSLLASGSRRQRSPVLVSQAVAIIIASPVVALTLYQNPPTRWAEPRAGYLGLGYALDPVVSFWSTAPASPADDVRIRIVLTLTLVLAGVFLARRSASDVGFETPGPILASRSWLALLALASVMAASIVFFATWTQPRDTIAPALLASVAVFPLALAAGMPLWLKLANHRFLHRGWLVRLTRFDTLPAWLAFLPFVCMLGVSTVRASFTARGTLIFLPFLLMAVALGVDALFRWRWIGRTALATMALLVVGSIRYYRSAESSPRDYGGLAAALQQTLAPDDLILLRARSYADGPLLYYFTPPFEQFIGRDHAESLRQRGHQSRVWVIQWGDNRIPDDIDEAIRGYRPSTVLTSHHGTATAFLPP